MLFERTQQRQSLGAPGVAGPGPDFDLSQIFCRGVSPLGREPPCRLEGQGLQAERRAGDAVG